MRIDVTPSHPNPDTEPHIRLLDLPPGEPVPGRAGYTDPGAGHCRSSAEFVGSADGTDDGADPMDLVNAAGSVLSHPTAAADS